MDLLKELDSAYSYINDLKNSLNDKIGEFEEKYADYICKIEYDETEQIILKVTIRDDGIVNDELYGFDAYRVLVHDELCENFNVKPFAKIENIVWDDSEAHRDIIIKYISSEKVTDVMDHDI